MEASGGGSNLPSEDLHDLRDAVRELQRRVSRLEQNTANLAPLPAPVLAAGPTVRISFDAAPTFGVAMLGIAGAYLLRALAEMGTFPLAAGVAAGIAYAGAWLWFAARASRKLAAVAYVFTSMLILAPLIWEATVEFGAVPRWIAAAIAAAFAMAAEAVSWRKNLKPIAGIPPAGCAALTLALLVGTHDLLPFTIALLAIAAVVEFAAVLDHSSAARWIAAAAANVAVSVDIILVSRPQGLPEGYAPLSPRAALILFAALPAVYVSSAIARTLLRRKTFAIFEIFQTVCAFAIGFGGILYVSRAVLPAGMVFAAAGIASYFAAFRWSQRRNRNTYATFGLALIIAAAWMLTSGIVLAAVWSVLAIAASFRIGWHGLVYLWLAAAVSGAIGGAAAQFIGNGGPFPLQAALIPLIASILCYAVFRSTAERLPAAALAVWIAGGAAAGHLPIACPATIIATLIAVALAWSGIRWRRPELVWMMYAAMTLAGYRIVSHDIASARNVHLVAPLLFYGAAWIVLPKILDKRNAINAGA